MGAQISRRAILGAAPVLATAAAVNGCALMADGDQSLFAAWTRRQRAFAAMRSSGPEHEDDFWQIIDQAEGEIRAATASSPRGVAIQLTCALAHCELTAAQSAEVETKTARAIDDSAMNWDARLIVSALRSLETMEA